MRNKKRGKTKIYNLIKMIIGIILIILGITGFILPIIPGIIFVILGVILIGNKKMKNYLRGLLKETKKAIKK